jgi:hypothetical protein
LKVISASETDHVELSVNHQQIEKYYAYLPFTINFKDITLGEYLYVGRTRSEREINFPKIFADNYLIGSMYYDVLSKSLKVTEADLVARPDDKRFDKNPIYLSVPRFFDEKFAKAITSKRGVTAKGWPKDNTLPKYLINIVGDHSYIFFGDIEQKLAGDQMSFQITGNIQVIQIDEDYQKFFIHYWNETKGIELEFMPALYFDDLIKRHSKNRQTK